MPHQREIYFHEDDYCQQQLLPRGAAAFAESELKKSGEFADAHRAPGGLGWTDIYVLQEAPVELRTLRITKEKLAEIVTPILPTFDVAYTGYSSHREQCRNTAAWGRSTECALFADWDDDGIVAHVWAEFFDDDDASILAATQAVAALGNCYPLIYVDWAWEYMCDSTEQDVFAATLRKKLKTIADKAQKFTTG